MKICKSNLSSNTKAMIGHSWPLFCFDHSSFFMKVTKLNICVAARAHAIYLNCVSTERGFFIFSPRFWMLFFALMPIFFVTAKKLSKRNRIKSSFSPKSLFLSFCPVKSLARKTSLTAFGSEPTIPMSSLPELRNGTRLTYW